MPTPTHSTLHPGSRAAHPAFTVSRPNIARVYDYWLGGKDNFAADRDEADRLLQAYPLLPAKVRENRLFLARAVNWMANQGLRQFVDIGSGLPTAQNTHQVAQAVDPSCRVAYVDYDPIVVAHARALLGADGVTAAEGDLGDPAAILGDSAVGQVIRLGEPVGLILGMVLHFFDAQAVGEIMATIVRSIAPGSYVVISVGSGDERTAARLAREYTAETLYNHPPTQIARFFDGLELVAPGLADAGDWDPRGAACPPAETGGHILVGVGRKGLKPQRLPQRGLGRLLGVGVRLDRRRPGLGGRAAQPGQREDVGREPLVVGHERGDRRPDPPGGPGRQQPGVERGERARERLVNTVDLSRRRAGGQDAADPGRAGPR
jgi:S-adenosyl methyltransferase